MSHWKRVATAQRDVRDVKMSEKHTMRAGDDAR
jgi:hypothetical protein